METQDLLEKFDTWITDEPAAPTVLVIQETLAPVGGEDVEICPPTYAPPPEGKVPDDWSPYVIDRIGNTTTCLLASPGARGNHMESLFKQDPHIPLVPQNAISVKDKTIFLVDVAHRLADAFVRYSGWAEEAASAIRALENGDAQPLAKLASTTLVFGIWDSRADDPENDSRLKHPRLVSSRIRAFDVYELRTRAQYTPPVNYVRLGLTSPDKTEGKGVLSKMGCAPVPATKPTSRGGVIVRGKIVCTTELDLMMLRTLATIDAEATTKLRRYILGLCLVAATCPQEYRLRQDCRLYRTKMEQRLAYRTHVDDAPPEREGSFVTYKEALEYALAAADAFGVEKGRTLPFLVDKFNADVEKRRRGQKPEQEKDNGDGRRGKDAARRATETQS